MYIHKIKKTIYIIKLKLHHKSNRGQATYIDNHGENSFMQRCTNLYKEVMFCDKVLAYLLMISCVAGHANNVPLE